MVCLAFIFLIQFNDLLCTLVAPKIAPFDFGNEPSNSGDSASVQCLVTSGDLPLDLKWLFNDRPVSEIFGISTVKLGKRTYALTIDSVTDRHYGKFTCEAKNMAGVDRYNAELIVNGTELRNCVVEALRWCGLDFRRPNILFRNLFPFISFCVLLIHFHHFSFRTKPNQTKTLVPPSIAHFNFGDKPSNFGDSASVQCLVTSGDLPIDFKWYFNGRPVKEYAGITTVKLGNRNSVLNIDSVTASHAGNFTCNAANLAASLNFTSELVVKGTQYSNHTVSKASNDNFI